MISASTVSGLLTGVPFLDNSTLCRGDPRIKRFEIRIRSPRNRPRRLKNFPRICHPDFFLSMALLQLGDFGRNTLQIRNSFSNNGMSMASRILTQQVRNIGFVCSTVKSSGDVSCTSGESFTPRARVAHVCCGMECMCATLGH